MAKSKKHILYLPGLIAIYFAFSLALLVNSQAFASWGPGEASSEVEKELSQDTEGLPASEMSIGAASLEAVVNAPINALDSPVLIPQPLSFPLLPELKDYPELPRQLLPYWQNTFGYIIVINGP